MTKNLIILALIVFVGCTSEHCGQFTETDLGKVVNYHREGLDVTVIKTGLVIVSVEGIIPVKEGSSVVMYEWIHPNAPLMRRLHFVEYHYDATIIDVVWP